MEDSEIVERVLAGEKGLFAELVFRHKDMVYGMASRYSNAAEAEDLAQEVFLRAYRSLASFRGGAKFSTWLFRICRNLCLDWLKGKARRGSTIELEEESIIDQSPTAEDGCVDEDEKARINRAVARLKPAFREAVILHYRGELPVPEIARLTGLPERTIETRLYRARKALRKILEREGA